MVDITRSRPNVKRIQTLVSCAFSRTVMALLFVLSVAPELSAETSRETLAEQFRDPPMKYGSIDNWWWEGGRVNKDKLTWQLEELKDKGIAGTWFYPRWVYGEAESLTSDPPYWSEEWWDLTRFSVEEHKRLGLTHWFSNWDLTQFQQDLVRKEKETKADLEGRVISIHRIDKGGVLELREGEEVIDAAVYRKIGDGIDYGSRKELDGVLRDTELSSILPGADWVAAVITSQPWDLNYLDKQVGERFAEAFLGEYERRLPEFIGNTLEAFGADEIILLNSQIMYSSTLMDRVRRERGYDLRPYLVGLFYDIGTKTDQVRYDYYNTMSAMLEENFYRPILEWLEERGMTHAELSQLGSGDPLQQALQFGDILRYHRTFHVPGNEDPGRHEPGDRRLISSKISSSIAHLYERPRAEMCVYYASGWGQTQEENIAWTNENYAKGLNLHTRCVVQLNLMAGWYEWVPPSDHFFQPHWRYWKRFADYVRRLSFLLSQGKHRADVALLYPITTIHADWKAGWNSAGWPFDEYMVSQGKGPFGRAAREASDSMKDLAKAIYHDGIDFNFMDKESLERATVEGGILEVAGVEFRSIVLPAMSTIRLVSMRKIQEFYEAGGTVVSFGRIPTASAENGRDDPELRGIIEDMFGTLPTSDDGIISRRNDRGGHAYFVPSEVDRIPQVLSQAIIRDVSAPERDLFHLHKRIGDTDVYFLFNVKQEARELPVRFRAQGRVEIWDAFTGETRPAYRWRRIGDMFTEVMLEMERNEGVIVTFSPGESGPAVVETNVENLVELDVQEDTIEIEGLDKTGGDMHVRILHNGAEYLARGSVPATSDSIRLKEPFRFRLEPTMDNRWGDFRYPASETFIGAEARTFRYAEENGATGTDRSWHSADFDDTQWPEVTYSYGPYWWHLGGFPAGQEPEDLREQAKRGIIDVERSWLNGMDQLAWQPHVFSQKFGHLSLTDKYATNEIEGLLGVPPNFLVMGQTPPGGDAHYWFTNVHVPAAGEYVLQAGVSPDKLFFSLPFKLPPEKAPHKVNIWLNGETTPLEFERESSNRRGQVSRTRLKLRQGWNTILLEVIREKGDPSSFYAALYQTEPGEQRYVPRLRWFREAQELVYDITPNEPQRLGWYRFKAPPGVSEIQLPEGIRAESVQAWIDGEPAAINDGKITFRTPRTLVSQVALRVKQRQGYYGGAVFPTPVTFKVEMGEIPLGDWSQYGLATYSGIGIYSQEFQLGRSQMNESIILDLGHVRNVAEVFVNGKPAGVKFTRPFRFEITDLVRFGKNSIEVRVANSLANHMTTYPTKWVLEDQAIAGLLGPVTIEFRSKIGLTARPVQ